jgi:hypothetical protein
VQGCGTLSESERQSRKHPYSPRPCSGSGVAAHTAVKHARRRKPLTRSLCVIDQQLDVVVVVCVHRHDTDGVILMNDRLGSLSHSSHFSSLNTQLLGLRVQYMHVPNSDNPKHAVKNGQGDLRVVAVAPDDPAKESGIRVCVCLHVICMSMLFNPARPCVVKDSQESICHSNERPTPYHF